jgi:hypothetical protein
MRPKPARTFQAPANKVFIAEFQLSRGTQLPYDPRAQCDIDASSPQVGFFYSALSAAGVFAICR